MKFTQLGKPFIAFFFLMEAVINWSVLRNADSLSVAQIICFNIIPLVIFLFLYKLDARVTDTTIVITFGIGLIKRRIKLTDIQEAKLLKDMTSEGLRLRQTADYTLYTVGGMDTVVLILNDKISYVRIGCDAPQLLVNYINSKILKT
ncbi:MAG: hypothetical protein EBR30_02840 [Cytophagia bacterium]|nr:hypothetical protein [Cytophagia bacterium]